MKVRNLSFLKFKNFKKLISKYFYIFLHKQLFFKKNNANMILLKKHQICLLVNLMKLRGIENLSVIKIKKKIIFNLTF